MATFSNEEYADILFMYGRANGNASGAQRLYREHFPDRRVPNVHVFGNTFRRLRETGSLHRRESGVNPGRHVPEVEEQILEAFAADPNTSTRKVARELHLSRWKVWAVLYNEKKYPWHYTPVQGLEEGDPARRIAFCRFLLNTDIEDGSFLKSILWTDESKFSREGITNFHNLHYWADADENPHVKKQTSFQYKFSVNVWAGVIGGNLIGPYYLPQNLNGENYLEFLENSLPVLLEDLPLNVRRNLIFQNDGCPAHCRITVRQFLDEKFPNRWIGRNGPILWPARSPDLTPLDFYVWGRMKELVYDEEIRSREHLINKINQASQQMKEEMRLGIVTTEVRRRARACVRHRGSHFEHEK